MPDLIVADMFPATPMMADSLIEEFGVEGVLVILCRELEGSARTTDIFARSHISALLEQLASVADEAGESITADQKQTWIEKHGFDITI